jgi:hypothetical protein
MTLISFSIGNIVGTEIFQPKDAPAYVPGKIAILVSFQDLYIIKLSVNITKTDGILLIRCCCLLN